MVAAAVLGAGALSAGASILGSSNAADAQTKASDAAIAAQKAQYAQTRRDLLPYNTAGQSALNALSYGLGIGGSPGASGGSGGGPDYNAYLAANPDVLAAYNKADKGYLQNSLGINSPQDYAQYHYDTYGKSEGRALPSINVAPPSGADGGAPYGGLGFGSLAAPVRMDQSTLEQTPGYQFNLSQGLKSVQNSAAARGLSGSGAALKGAAAYATGLADSTYQNQFQNAVTNSTNTYNRLSNLAGLGENAAATTGNYGTQTGANIGNNLVGIGNARAGADIAGANAIGGIGSSVGNLYLTNALLKSGGGSGLFGAGGGGLNTSSGNDTIGY